MSMTLRLGTRGSPLALAQADQVKAAMEKAQPGLAVERVVIRTTGDTLTPEKREQDRAALKGLFVKEIEEALMDGRVDLAVHSVKDMETEIPPGLMLAAVMKREDSRDAAVVRGGGSLKDLPAGARIGVSSLRRIAQLKRLRRDLEYLPIRGNVDTRLKKLDAGEYDAVILAGCGLIRLGVPQRISEWLDPAVCLPAVGQGALGIEAREDRADLKPLWKLLDDPATHAEIDAERALLAALGGDCRVPIGGLAKAAEENMTLEGVVLSPDGLKALRKQVSGSRKSARALGIELASRLRAVGADRLLFSGWAQKGPDASGR